MSEKTKPYEYGWSSSAESHTSAYLSTKVLDLLAGLKVKRVVDLGAGNGALCGKLNAAGYETVGVEYDQAGVKIAAETYPEIPFYHLDVTESSATLLDHESPFDAVVSTEVIEHLYSPGQFAAYTKDVLKPGGYLILSTPYHGYLKNLLLSLTNKWDDHHTALWQGGHIKFWSRKTLSKLLHDHGFDVLEFHGAGRLRYVWKSMILVAVSREKEGGDE